MAPSPSATPEDVDGAATDESTGPPWWLWWLLAAVVAGLAVAAILFARSRRHRAWDDDFGGAVTEVAWFARTLLPQLQSGGSPDQVAGGWAVGSTRVKAAEDRLTALEATAPGEDERSRAQTLRDAVRQAREAADRLVAPGSPGPGAGELAAISARLESTIAAVTS